jgi:hypothetical protein
VRGMDGNMGWVTGYNMGWETIIYINIYFVDATKDFKEKRLKFYNITSKWVNVKK